MKRLIKINNLATILLGIALIIAVSKNNFIQSFIIVFFLIWIEIANIRVSLEHAINIEHVKKQ
jgi:tryptophan-rich sensory protein